MSDEILRDPQACVLCEDVLQEASGQQTLVGVIEAIPAPAFPLGFFKLCLWSRKFSWPKVEGSDALQNGVITATALASKERNSCPIGF